MSYLGLLLILAVQAAKPVPAPDMPAGPGVYVRQVDSHWAKIEPASLADTKSNGLGLFIESGGFYSPNMTVVYKGARAPAQIAVARPTFFVRGVGSAGEVTMVLLTRKRDTRTLETSAADASADNKGGFRKRDLQGVTAMEYADGSYSITPDHDLKSGEYLLLLGLAYAGYDFGVIQAK
jgi:hypothetical protein